MKLKKVESKGRIFFVGDIHGCYEQLIMKMESVDFDEYNGDIIVAVGDLIDRGPDSAKCLNLIEKEWFHTVKGNHEDMMANAISEGVNSYLGDLWLSNGGKWYNELTDKEKNALGEFVENKVKTLPILIEATKGNKTIGVAHGGIYSLMWDEIVSNIDNISAEEYILWCRDQANSAQAFHRKSYDKVDSRLIGTVKGVDAVVFGHTPMKQGALKIGNMLWLDTGAVYGNDLGFIEFDDIISA